MNEGVNYNYAGRRYKNTGGAIAVNISDSYNLEFIVNPLGTIITLTGFYRQVGGKYYYQLTRNAEQWADISSGWQPYSLNSTRYSTQQAQNIVNGIIKNNQYILINNLFCARFANRLNIEERRLLYSLQYRLQERNSALQNNSLLQISNAGYPEEWIHLENYLVNFISNPEIGIVISSTAVLITAALVVASLSTAAYFAYQAYFKQSENDVKYSKKLAETLQDKLTNEEYEQLRKETQGMITKAKIQQQISSIGGNIKTLLLIVAGAFVVLRLPQWIKSIQSEPVKKQK